MNAWSTLLALVDEELIDERQLSEIRELVRSAGVAGIRHSPSVVSQRLWDRLEAGDSVDEALRSVGDLVAIHHNRMLIDRCRGMPDAVSAAVIEWPRLSGRPIHAA
jgi:hypothetical protein